MLALMGFNFCITKAQVDGEFPIRAFASINGRLIDPILRKPITISGEIKLLQECATCDLNMTVSLTSAPKPNNALNHKIGSHFHKFGVPGVITNSVSECLQAGPHFNPLAAIPPENFITGELGNFIFEAQNGEVTRTLKIPKLNLFGPDSVVGRSFVFHERPDDYTLINVKDKNSKNVKIKPIPMIACGNIVLQGGFKTKSSVIDATTVAASILEKRLIKSSDEVSKEYYKKYCADPSRRYEYCSSLYKRIHRN